MIFTGNKSATYLKCLLKLISFKLIAFESLFQAVYFIMEADKTWLIKFNLRELKQFFSSEQMRTELKRKIYALIEVPIGLSSQKSAPAPTSVAVPVSWTQESSLFSQFSFILNLLFNGVHSFLRLVPSLFQQFLTSLHFRYEAFLSLTSRYIF